MTCNDFSFPSRKSGFSNKLDIPSVAMGISGTCMSILILFGLLLEGEKVGKVMNSEDEEDMISIEKRLKSVEKFFVYMFVISSFMFFFTRMEL